MGRLASHLAAALDKTQEVMNVVVVATTKLGDEIFLEAKRHSAETDGAANLKQFNHLSTRVLI